MATTSANSPTAARRLPAWRRILQTTINWAVLLAIVVGVGYFLRTRAHEKAAPTSEAEAPPARLSDKFPDTLELAPTTVEAMHVQVVAVKPAPLNTPLKLYGSLYLEGSRLVHVQTRFSGQVVEVGETHEEGDGKTRALRPGDQVSTGQVLAKLWSREVGEKKSELVDAISNLYFHEASLKRYQDLVPSGGVPLKTLQE